MKLAAIPLHQRAVPERHQSPAPAARVATHHSHGRSRRSRWMPALIWSVLAGGIYVALFIKEDEIGAPAAESGLPVPEDSPGAQDSFLGSTDWIEVEWLIASGLVIAGLLFMTLLACWSRRPGR